MVPRAAGLLLPLPPLGRSHTARQVLKFTNYHSLVFLKIDLHLGFLSQSRSLLAWEIPLQNASFGSLAERWPNLAEAALKKQQASDVLDKCELLFISPEGLTEPH